MGNRRFFSKLKDYNYVLDQLLEKKRFLEDTKNLLLSMFYKIETSFDDYAKIKMVHVSKSEFLEEIIKDIDEYCNFIYLLDPKREEIQSLKSQDTLALTEEREKKVYSYPTEVALLYGIADIKPKYFFIHEKYDYIKNVFQKLLAEGSNLNRTEVIRNFNGWSWDPDGDKHINFLSNLIYQNLSIVFGDIFLKRWENDSSPRSDYILEMKKRLKEGYDEKIMKSFYNSLFKLLFVLSENRGKYREKYNQFVKMYSEVENKTEYILKLSREKVRNIKRIENIDKIMESQELLFQEFKRKNEKLPDGKKLFNISDLADLLQKEKEVKIKRVKQLTELEKPSNYENLKNDLKEKIEIMSVLDLKEINVNDFIISFEKEFLKCIDKEIEEISERDEYIELLYKLRYCKRLRINSDTKIGDIKVLDNLILKIMKKIVTKACQNKIFNVFSRNIDINFNIISKVVDSTIVNFEDIDISLQKEDSDLAVCIWDNDVLEKKEVISFNFDKRELSTRFKKKVPLYVF